MSIDSTVLGDKIKQFIEELDSSPKYETLPGTQYSRYAVPIEYTPSRDYRPRWGNSKPPIEYFVNRFTREAEPHRQQISKLIQYAGELTDVPAEFREEQLPMPAWNGTPYSPFDALALYSVIRDLKPRRYIEIGSGITTCWAKLAAAKNETATEITSIDPQPRTAVNDICDKVVRDGLETVDVSLFDTLEAGDILFFDGSHRTFMNSDVTVFFIDVLPRIKPGVIVHVHDIAIPYDYPEMFANWYWNEQYMLAVYLMSMDHKVEIRLPTTWLCRNVLNEQDEAALLKALPHAEYWRGGGAMWFSKRTAG